MAKKSRYKNQVSWIPQQIRLASAEASPHEPMTWIYGDSFAQHSRVDPTWYTWWALDHSDLIKNRAEPGSGLERAIMHWYYDHSRGRHGKDDRVLICLSEISRLFQNNVSNVNWWTGLHPPEDTAQWQAINQYYRYLARHEEPIWPIRRQSLLQWLDRELARSPAQTLIAHSFAVLDQGTHYDAHSDLTKNHVSHWFENADNLWPSLMHFSVTDPDYTGNIGQDTRTGHMSRRQHEMIYQRLKTQTGDRYIESMPPGFTPVKLG